MSRATIEILLATAAPAIRRLHEYRRPNANARQYRQGGHVQHDGNFERRNTRHAFVANRCRARWPVRLRLFFSGRKDRRHDTQYLDMGAAQRYRRASLKSAKIYRGAVFDRSTRVEFHFVNDGGRLFRIDVGRR